MGDPTRSRRLRSSAADAFLRLLVGTQMAPECALPASGIDPSQLAPGARLKLRTSGEGIMRFQCCFHPWMRATVRVVPDEHHGK